MKANDFTNGQMEMLNRLAAKIAGNNRFLRDDLVQEGYLALRYAAREYDPSRGVPFSSYAYLVVSRAMWKASRQLTQVVRIPLNRADDVAPRGEEQPQADDWQDKEASDDFEPRDVAEWQDEADWREVAEEQGISCCPNGNRTFYSFDDVADQPCLTRSCEGLMPYLRDKEFEERLATAKEMVGYLQPKERLAITMLFELDGLYERPLTAVADELGCSVEGARKICDRGLKTIREWLGLSWHRMCA